MASTNPDSMSNAQGEFQPSRPRDQPIETGGHQVGQLVGNDAAPEFHAKTLPPGSAPAESTFKPNPINEIPGQANNDDVLRSHGKEGVKTNALDTLGGATSGDVHQGLGKPMSGQTSTELHQGGKSAGTEGQVTGGSGLRLEENAEAKRLQRDNREGPSSAKEHNVSLTGAEGKESESAEQVASGNA